MEHFIKKNTWLNFTPHGWGNGYVVVPKGHLLNGVSYTEIDNIVDVHGGLTLSDKPGDLGWPELKRIDKDAWIFGFDTAHLRDTIENWPEEAVEEETLRLKEQLGNVKMESGQLISGLNELTEN